MTTSLAALLGYAAWTLALLGGIAALRSALVLSGQRAANRFAPSGDDVSDFSGRLCRAHANCYENLPAFAALVLVAHVSGNAAVTDPLAAWVLVARMAQSSVHLASTSALAVQARFGFFFAQFAIQAWWVISLARIALEG